MVGVWPAVVVVEDHDGGDDAAGHHEHDAVEVGSDEGAVARDGDDLRHRVQEYRQGQQDRHSWTVTNYNMNVNSFPTFFLSI